MEQGNQAREYTAAIAGSIRKEIENYTQLVITIIQGLGIPLEPANIYQIRDHFNQNMITVKSRRSRNSIVRTDKPKCTWPLQRGNRVGQLCGSTANHDSPDGSPRCNTHKGKDAPAPKSNSSSKSSRTLTTMEHLKKRAKEKTPLNLKVNSWGNLEHANTSLVFEELSENTYHCIGVQNISGAIDMLTSQHVMLCEDNSWAWDSGKVDPESFAATFQPSETGSVIINTGSLASKFNSMSLAMPEEEGN